MTRKITAAALAVSLIVFAASRVMAHGKDVVLSFAARAIVLTLDTSASPPSDISDRSIIRTAAGSPATACEKQRLLTARG